MLSIAILLLILWLLAFFAFHFTSSLIHLLLVASMIALVVGLLRRRA